MTLRSSPLTAIVLTIALGIVGCAGRSFKADHPVVGPAPPRVLEGLAKNDDDVSKGKSKNRSGRASPSANDIAAASDLMLATGQEEALDETTPTGDPLFDEAPAGVELSESMMVARLNGRILFVSDLLDRYAPQFQSVRSQGVSPKELREQQIILIRRDLSETIDQKLMADQVLLKLKKEQMEKINEQIDKLFVEYELQLQEKYKAPSTAEVEKKLQEMGTSLVNMRKAFGEQQFARQFITGKLGTAIKENVDRLELLEAYNQRAKEFTEPEQVKWQTIVIKYSKHDGKEGAMQVVEQVRADLQQGLTFDESVAKWSEAPPDDSKGTTSWTQPESIADQELLQALKTMPLNVEYRVLENTKAKSKQDWSFRIVRVVGRKPSRKVPFDEVQTQLREKIVESRRSVALKKILKDLRKDAVIEVHPLFKGAESETK